MIDGLSQELNESTRLAIASARAEHGAQFAALLALDARLGKLVGGASEPMLGQMRLAWWRDQLAADPMSRPRGDAVLDSLSDVYWQSGQVLVGLVDGWEQFLIGGEDAAKSISALANGRAGAFCTLGEIIGTRSAQNAVRNSAHLWSHVDVALHASDAEDRVQALKMAGSIREEKAALDRDMRPLAVLRGLAVRVLDKDLTQMMGDRFSPLAALRLGIFGR